MNRSAGPQDRIFAEQAASARGALSDLSRRADLPSPSGGYPQGGAT